MHKATLLSLLTNFNQTFVTKSWFFSSTSMICINVKPKLIWSGSDSFTTGRSSVLYGSRRSCNSRFSLYPAEHTANEIRERRNFNDIATLYISSPVSLALCTRAIKSTVGTEKKGKISFAYRFFILHSRRCWKDYKNVTKIERVNVCE